MLKYTLRRLLYMVFIMAGISVLSFIIIQLPPGDFLTTYIMQLSASGMHVQQDLVDALKVQYGLDKPLYAQYWLWISGFVRGDMGWSFQWGQPVTELLAERIPLTMVISLSTLVFTYALAIPIGIYSAAHQYSVGDYLFTFTGFIGLATPNFLLALLLMFYFFKFFGLSVGGLFSTEYATAPWSLAKVLDMIEHLWVVIIVIGTGGTAGIIRVMRGTLLDELGKQYVITARSKGVSELRLLFRYPVRVAINPIISTVGWLLPTIVSGAAITAVVLSLPTTGVLLLGALVSQDMYLAGSIIMVLSSLTVVGTLISDLLLAWADPRIRFEA